MMTTTTFTVPVAPLFVPGDRPERFVKALASGADAIIIDLEDAVASASKTAARTALQNHLPRDFPVLVRINTRTSPHFDADLAALASLPHDRPLAAVMLAKAGGPDDIAAVRAVLGAQMIVIPLIETAAALANLAALLHADGVGCAAFGSLDFALDLGCQPTWDALLLARLELVLRSRLAGLPPPLDGVTTTLDNDALIEADACRVAALGFGGKLAIHPKQVAAIQRAFQPDPATLAWAEKVLEAATRSAVMQVDGAMVDAPLIERARRILAGCR